MATDYEENLGPSIYPESPKPSFPTILQRVVTRHFPILMKSNSCGIMDSRLKKLEGQMSNFKDDIDKYQENISRLNKENELLKQENSKLKLTETEFQVLKTRNKELEDMVIHMQRENWELKRSSAGRTNSRIDDLQESEDNVNQGQTSVEGKHSKHIHLSNFEKALWSDRFATFLSYDDGKLVWTSFKKEKKVFVCRRCGKPGHPKSKCNLSGCDTKGCPNLVYTLYVQKRVHHQHHETRVSKQSVHRARSDLKEPHPTTKSVELESETSMEHKSSVKELQMVENDNISGDSISSPKSCINQEIPSQSLEEDSVE